MTEKNTDARPTANYPTVMDTGPRRTPPVQLWTTPTVAAALATCDIPKLMEEVRVGHGWSQDELANVLGYSQSWVSKVVRGQTSLTVDQVRDISDKLGIPVHLLRFGDPGSEDVTNRRQFARTVALAALSVPIVRADEIDVTTAATLRTITGGQRRLDASTSARELAKAATAHLELASGLAARSRRTEFAKGIAEAASEAAGFAAWLYADMHDLGSARSYYRSALTHARIGGNSLLGAYMLGSRASFEIDGGNPELGLTLTRDARNALGDSLPLIAQAWLSCIEALAYASLPRRAAQSDAAIARAEEAVFKADGATPPIWPWVFQFDYAKMSGYRAMAAVRLGRTESARNAFAESVPAASGSPKQRAILMLELAGVHTQAGDVDEAFRLAGAALAIGCRYSSERIIQCARRFRRRYVGPESIHVRSFDKDLNASLL